MALRVTARRLSSSATAGASGAAGAPVAAATAAVADKPFIGPRVRIGAGLSAAAAAALGGVSAYVAREFQRDVDFRERLRREAPGKLVALLEQTIAEYWPQGAQAIRIDDEYRSAEKSGSAETSGSGGSPFPSELLVMPAPVGGVPKGLNPGRTFLPGPDQIRTQEEGTVQFFRKLNEPAAPPDLNPDPDSSTPEAASPSAEDGAAAEVGGVPSSLLGTTPSLAEPAGPVAEDEAEPTHDPSLAYPDGTVWTATDGGSGVDGGVLCAWAAASPPELAERLTVSAAAAHRFETQRARFEAIREALATGGEVAAAAAVGSSEKVSGGGERTIELPEYMRDGMYGTAEAEGNFAPEAAPAAAVRALRLHWLRAHEAFVEAELGVLEARVGATRALSLRGEGGGNALLRMGKRHHQLGWKLKSIQREKKAVKASSRFTRLEPATLDELSTQS